MSAGNREFERRKALLIAEIYEAFRGVTREGGVSWSEADVIDGYGTSRERLQARAQDKDATWQSLVGSKDWQPMIGYGGFSFLDAIGFRYYLAPSMVRVLKDEPFEASLAFHLTLRSESKEYVWDQWSLIQGRQRRCVRDFVLLMRDLEKADPNDVSKEWQEAWKSYWADAKITVP